MQCQLQLNAGSKSQIALQFAYWYTINFPEQSVYWINASSAERLQQALVDISLERRIPGVENQRKDLLQLLQQWLQKEENGGWLMIFDSADSIPTFHSIPKSSSPASGLLTRRASAPMVSYIPDCPHGKLLYTTNNKATGLTLTRQGHVIPIEAMTVQDSCQLLGRLLADEETPLTKLHASDPKSSHDGLNILSNLLDHIPLALAQAAAFMRENSMTVSQYLREVSGNASWLVDVLDRPSQGLGGNQDLPQAVTQTWKLCFDQIKTQDPPAAELLSLMAFLDPQGIPKSLLRHSQIESLDLTMALGALQAFSLITIGPNEEPSEMTFDMHRLVQVTTRKWLEKSGQDKTSARKALSLVSEYFPDGTFESWQACALSLPHALKVIQFDLHGPEDAVALGSLQFKVSWYYYWQGSYSKAKGLSEQAVKQMEGSLGPHHEQTLASKRKLAAISRKLGRYQKAEELAIEVSKQQKKLYGSNVGQMVELSLLLSLVYQDQGKYGEAIKECRKMLKRLEEPANHELLAAASVKLRMARNLENSDAYKEAEVVSREAAQVRTETLGPMHPDTLLAHYPLTQVLRAQGKYRETEKLALSALSSMRAVFGPNHPDTLKLLHSHALTLHARSQYQESEHLLRSIVAVAIKEFDTNHPDTLTALSSLTASRKMSL